MKMKCHEKLKALRKQAGYTQEGLANTMHVSRQAISLWENGTTLPDIDNLKFLSELYHVTIDTLIKEEEALDASLKQSDQASSLSSYQSWMHCLCTMKLRSYTDLNQPNQEVLFVQEHAQYLWFIEKRFRKQWKLGLVRKDAIQSFTLVKQRKQPMIPTLETLPTTDPFSYFLHQKVDILLRSDTLCDVLFKEHMIWEAVVEQIQDTTITLSHKTLVTKDTMVLKNEDIIMMKEA